MTFEAFLTVAFSSFYFFAYSNAFLITQNIGVRKISQKPVKVTKPWLIELVSWTNLGSLFGGDETDELA